ncbi:hypothetical protein POHY109586_06050 [Polaromonas hydrogenivorans]
MTTVAMIAGRLPIGLSRRIADFLPFLCLWRDLHDRNPCPIHP